jgi:hypothetical protein
MKKMVAGWKPPRKREKLAIHPSIKPEINHSSREMEKCPKDGTFLEGDEMLAVYPTIKPKNQSFVKVKGKMDTGWKPPRKGEGMLAVHQSIKPENQSFIK